MSITSRLLPLLCAGSTLLAQSNDINSLIGAAQDFTSAGISATRSLLKPDLAKVQGDAGAPAPLPILMFKGLDVSRWTFFYDLKNPYGPVDPAGLESAPKFRSVSAMCSQGIFGDFHMSSGWISDSKSLSGTWVGASLDTAIAALNAEGYERGFTGVTLMRSTSPLLPDTYVYAFTCPMERTVVGISASSATVVWKEMF